MLFTINIIAAWISFLSGAVTGAFIGLFFHKENWLNGYSSFSRRILRLGHIACFGIGILNLLFAFTSQLYPTSYWFNYASYSFLASFTMSIVCFLSAWKHFFRHLFFIPVLSLMSGIIFTLIGVLQ